MHDRTIKVLFTRGISLFGRGFWGAVLVLTMLNAVAAAITAVAVIAVSELAWAQRSTVFADGMITDRGIIALVAQVGIPAGILLALLTAAGMIALAAVLGLRYQRDEGRESALGLGGILVRTVKRALPILGAFILVVLEVLLAIVLAPLISLAGIVLLIVFAVRRMLRRRETSAEASEVNYWLSLPLLIAYAIPFGLAAVIFVHSLLILPVAAHERHGVFGILRRSSELTRGRAVRVGLVGAGGLLLYLLIVAGLGALTQVGVTQQLVTVLLLLAQFTVAAIPVAILVALYFGMTGGRVPPEHALAVESIPRRRTMAAVATGAAAALVLGFLVPVTVPQGAWADEGSDPSTSSGTDSEPAVPEPVEVPDSDPVTEPVEVPAGGFDFGIFSEDGEGPPAPDWWSQGRPTDDGRKFGSAACFDELLAPEINKPTLAMCVDSLGDQPDAAPGDGWCETSAGTCTLRAALEELSAWRAGHPSIFMATAAIASGTIHLTAPLVATTRFGLYGSQDQDWNDLGARLTIDGSQHGVQLFRVTTGTGGGAEFYDVVLRGGLAPTGTQGGAVQVLAGGVNLYRVSIDGNHATDAGAAGALYAVGQDGFNWHRIHVSGSAFVNNGIPACYAPGVEIDTWGTSTTIDADDPSCVGTVSTADSLATTLNLQQPNPQQPTMGGTVTYHAKVDKVQSGLEELAGTVTFYVEGQDPIVVAVPADGNVSALARAASAASYTLRAVYSGSPGYRGSTSEMTVTTDGAASDLVLTYQTDTDAGWYRGRPLTLIATVTSGGDGLVPTGEVVFAGGGNHLGTATLDADGRAVLETTITTEDGEQHSGSLRWGIHAAYTGDTVHHGSDDGDYLYLAPDRSIVTPTASKQSASPGESVTFTARVVSDAPLSVPAEYGTVRFSAFGVTHDVELNPSMNGEASFTMDNLAYGTLNMVVHYVGSSFRLLSGSSETLSFPVTGTVASQVTFQRGSSNPSLVGETVSFLVYVQAATSADGLPSPTGTVRLMQDDMMLAEGTLPNLSVANLPLGAHNLRIDYLGDNVYQPSSVNVAQTVQKMPTSIYFTRSPQTSVIGEPVEFNVFVNTSMVGRESQAVTEGEVRVVFGGSLVGTIDLAEGNTLRVPLPLLLGNEPITALYQGTDYYASSLPSTYVEHTQSKATAAVALEFADTTVPYVGTVEATVRVTGVAPSTVAPEWGTVRLQKSNGTPITGLAEAQLGSDGVARFTFDATRLGAGTHNIVALFSDNPWFNDRGSAMVTLTVPKHVPGLDLTVNGAATGATVWGQTVELNAVVSIPWVPDMLSGAQDPLGTVNFVLVEGFFETPLGSVHLNEQFRRATLAVPQNLLPPGEHEIEARFTPSPQTIDRLDFAYSDALALSVAAVPVEIEIQGLNAVLPGEPFLRSVMVREHPDFALAAQPEGSVRVSVDGMLLGTYPLIGLTNNGLPLHIGIANVNFAGLVAGAHAITVEYLPAATSKHAATTTDIDFVAGRVDPEITLEAATRTVAFDTFLFFTAGVQAPFSHYPAPHGKIVITDGEPGGASCEFLVIPGTTPSSNTCALYWAEAGSPIVRAVFVPDDSDQTYAETTSLYSLAVTVQGREPFFNFSARMPDGFGSQPTAGETVRVQWDISGTSNRTPEGGITLSVSPANAVPAGALEVCDTGALSGSCDVPITIAGAAAAQVVFTSAYAGDTRFLATTRTASLSPRDCVALSLQVVPSHAGTLTPQQAANCGEPGAPKTGYSEFTVVTFAAAPLPSNDLSYNWVLADPVSIIESAQGHGNGFVVTPAANWARTTFTESYQCVLVMIDVTNAPAMELSGEVRLPGGSSRNAPNCTYDGMQRLEHRYQPGVGSWSRPSVRTSTAHYSAYYLRGSVLDGIWMNRLTEDAKIYAFEGEGFERDGERIFAPNPLMNTAALKVTFGPTCYAATAEALGAGEVTIQNPQNCAEPAAGTNRGEGTGTEGWVAGTVLRYQATPKNLLGDTIGYVKTWAGTDRYAETSPAEYAPATRFEETAAQQVETALVRANQPAPHATVAFEECHLVTLDRGRAGIRLMDALPSFTGESNCGHPLAYEIIDRSTPWSVFSGVATKQPVNARQYVVEGTSVGIETPEVQTLSDVHVGLNSRIVLPFADVWFIGWDLSSRMLGDARNWPAGMSQDMKQFTVTEPVKLTPYYSAPLSCEASARVSAGDPYRVRVTSELTNLSQRCGTRDLDGGSGNYLWGDLPGFGYFAQHADVDAAKNSSITMTAEVAEGLNPIIGWELKASVSDPRVKPQLNPGDAVPSNFVRYVTLSQAVVGSQVTMPLGFNSLQAKAVICQQLHYSVNVTREDGEVLRNFDNGDELLMAYPAPNCPVAPNAWLVGTSVELWAFGNPAGYRFTGWEGEVDAGEGGVVHAENTGLAALLGDGLEEFLGAGFPANAVTVVHMDGTAPTKRVDANYQVQCYDVTIFSKKVESSTDVSTPNCPGFEGKMTLISNITGQPYEVADVKGARFGTVEQAIYRAGAKEMTGRYIGGTEVTAVADPDWSDQVWLGWREDVVDASKDSGRFNPATILVGTGSKPGGDSYVINRYRDRSDMENLEKIGNDIAIGIKKGIGFASIIVTDYIVNYPPIGTAFMVADGMALLESLLEMAGVPDDYISWMGYPKQIADMMKAPLACIGTWALGASGRDAASNVIGSTSDLAGGASRATAVTEAATKVTAQQAAMRAGNTGVLASAKLGFYQGKLGLAQLQKVTGTASALVSTGMAIYGAIDDGLAWDKNAEEAWTNFDAYEECIKAAIPSFLKGSEEAEKAVLDYAEKMREEFVGDHDFARLTQFTVGSGAVADPEAQWSPQNEAEAARMICEAMPNTPGCAG